MAKVIKAVIVSAVAVESSNAPANARVDETVHAEEQGRCTAVGNGQMEKFLVTVERERQQTSVEYSSCAQWLVRLPTAISQQNEQE